MKFLCSCLGNEKVQKELKNHLQKPIDSCKVLLAIYEETYGTPTDVLCEYKVLLKCGFSAENIMVIELKDYTKLETKNYDVLVVPGGNTFSLLDLIRKTSFDKFIKEFVNNGGFYIGESAGAHILFDSVEHVVGLDDNNVGLTNFSGLELISGLLIPHYDESRYWNLVYCQKEYNPVYTLTNDEYMCFN